MKDKGGKWRKVYMQRMHIKGELRELIGSQHIPAVNYNWSVAISPLCLHDAANDGDDIVGVVNLTVWPPVQQVKVTHTVSLTRLKGKKRSTRIYITLSSI